MTTIKTVLTRDMKVAKIYCDGKIVKKSPPTLNTHLLSLMQKGMRPIRIELKKDILYHIEWKKQETACKIAFVFISQATGMVNNILCECNDRWDRDNEFIDALKGKQTRAAFNWLEENHWRFYRELEGFSQTISIHVN